MLVLTRRADEKLIIGSAELNLFGIANRAAIFDMTTNGQRSTVVVRQYQPETILIDGYDVTLHFLGRTQNQTRVGIDAPASVHILRAEIADKLKYKKTPSWR